MTQICFIRPMLLVFHFFLVLAITILEIAALVSLMARDLNKKVIRYENGRATVTWVIL